MDVLDLSMKAPLAPATVKASGTTEVKKPAAQGNSLPQLGQVRGHPESPQDKASRAQPDMEKLNGLVDQANHALAKRSSNLKFTMAEGTDIPVVRIEDSQTGELIRQIPSEQMIAIARALKEIKQGMVFEDKA